MLYRLLNMNLVQFVTYTDLCFQKEEEKLRAQLRRESQQRRMRERSNARGLSASYLEPDRFEDDEEALEQSLLAMKRQYKKGLAKGTYKHCILSCVDWKLYDN